MDSWLELAEVVATRVGCRCQLCSGPQLKEAVEVMASVWAQTPDGGVLQAARGSGRSAGTKLEGWQPLARAPSGSPQRTLSIASQTTR